MVFSPLKMDDFSFYSPSLCNLEEMKKELQTVKTINTNNLNEFKNLKNEIENSPLLACIDIPPINSKELWKDVEDYVKLEHELKELYEERNNEYMTLVKLEKQAHKEIRELGESCSKDLEKLKEERDKLKKCYKEQKHALNVCRKMYENCFNMSVNIEEFDENEYKARVSFMENEDFSVVFTISKSYQILDYETSVADENFLKIKESFNNKNFFHVLCKLRQFAIDNKKK